MTRGKFVLITDKTVFASCEFNGDMYYDDGWGIEVVKRLERVKSYEDFVKEVTAFDLANFGYQNEHDDYFGIHDYEIGPNEINFDKNYFGDWFSDYLYVLNLSSSMKEIVERNTHERLGIDPGEIQIYCFGKYEGSNNLKYPNGTIKCKSDDDDIAEENSKVSEESNSPFEDVTINSFTVSGDEINLLYKHGYIKAIPPTVQELYDALHCVIGNL